MKEIIKIRSEINEKEMKETITNINKKDRMKVNYGEMYILYIWNMPAVSIRRLEYGFLLLTKME